MVCQLDTLRKCLNVKDLKRELESLPPTLEDTYDQILLRIDDRHRTRAFKILQWLAFAGRPVTIEEAAEVLAVDLGGEGCYNPELKLLDPRDVLLLCSSLVTRTATSMDEDPEFLPAYYDDDIKYDTPKEIAEVIRLAHLSVKDYLVSDRIRTSRASQFAMDANVSHISMAQTCIVYLSHSAFAGGYCKWDVLQSRLSQWPLYQYAAHFWPFHVNESPAALDDGIWSLLQRFFETKNRARGGNYAAWVVALTPNIALDSLQKTQPLYYAASFGITSLVQKLITSDPRLNVDAPGGRFESSPLQVAGYRHHPVTVKLLLESKANPMSCNRQGESCLLWATLRYDPEVQTLLRDHGATWTSQDNKLYRRYRGTK